MFCNASIMDKVNGQISIGSLANHIESEGNEARVYNTKGIPKAFDGNIQFFKSNQFQYTKRFHKGDCCTGENLIKWDDCQGTGNVIICKDCGFIVSANLETSKPEAIAELEPEAIAELEPEIPEGNLDSMISELIDIVEQE